MTATITVTTEGAVAEISLSNPPLNLITTHMLHELQKSLAGLTGQPDLRAVLVHGGGSRAFCAGSDMTEFRRIAETAMEAKILLEDHLLRTLERLDVPTIAVLDGAALGGGLELALACDLRVAHIDASLGLPETRIGGLASSGAVRLARLIGPARAMELLVTGRILSATEAEEWGIVNRVTAAPSALPAARELAREISLRGPMSNRLAKRLVRSAGDLPLDAALSQANRAQEKIFQSSDLHHGAEAFLTKQEPEFSNR